MRAPPNRWILLGLALPLAAALALLAPSLRLVGYAPRSFIPADTLRPKSSEAGPSTRGDAVGAAVPGYLSPWGLPPVRGRIVVTGSGLVFHPSQGTGSTHASLVSLAYVDDEKGRAHYLFRLDAGVFETEVPGPLLEAASEGVWSGGTGSGQPSRQPMQPADKAGSLREARRMASSRYADSLYMLLGKPRAAVGLIGPRGRAAGRLGEYILVRDSLALDPARMTGQPQLRHALAHELGHRWQARAKAQLAT
ncbi:MAG TPA: hypothetical protein VFZ87_00535, partial [Gemmatimonadales bacterium]